MLLESIKLENFRQFRNESIQFASGENGKNVTIIIGENGTGKTTFAQAFFWCLYGDTSFSDKVILNKKVATELSPNQEPAKVLVEIKLRHGDVAYTLTRYQLYRKEYSNRLTSDNTVFDIAKKGKDGNTEYVRKHLCEEEVKSILPKELSRYFFFDGERIEKMSKDISADKKSSEFAEAVKGLLGLNAMNTALEHLNPRKKTTVIGIYDNSYDSKSNDKIQEYTQTIQNCKSEIEKLENSLNDLKFQIDIAQRRKNEKEKEIRTYEEGEKLQNEKENINKSIETLEITRANTYKLICNNFNNNYYSFLSANMMKRALDLLSKENFTGKDIPHMRATTIEYLLKQKVCICGTCLEEGTPAYQTVKELIEFLPPQSISTTISDFKKEAKRRTNEIHDILGEIKESNSIISRQDEELLELDQKLRSIDKKLGSGDVREKVRIIHDEIQQCKDTITSSNTERDKILEAIGGYKKELETADTKRQNLSLLDEQNRKIEIYKSYAQRIYQELKEVYTKSEEEVRLKLQHTINEIFKKLYAGGLSLTINERYHISVHVNDYVSDVVETSTAQSISVIFAFITAIIKMARDNKRSDDKDIQLLTSESYPLVMDAPLSAFDKRRIKSVCEVLPEIAEQIIIFIKDTDGDLAEEHMGAKIGNRYYFDKINEFETILR